MYDQRLQEDFFYIMLYGAVAMMSLMSSCYLLFRRANAIAPDVASPVRLRRWTAVFFASVTLSHIWYMPIVFLTSSEDVMMSYLVGATLDFMTLIPSAIVLLFVMLQDRRRPLWPAFAMSAIPVAILAACIASRSTTFLPLLYAYYLSMALGLIIYIVRATRQYGHWLHDNYADLEHKEVWQSLVGLGIILLVFVFYSFCSKSMTCKYIVQASNILLISYLLWRVETLSELSITANDGDEARDYHDLEEEVKEETTQSSTVVENFGPLLEQYCEEPQLYLQYDMSAMQLAKLIGTNRVYLSKYFAMQGTTYNAYINGLRIRHFISLYHEAVATRQPVLAKQLAHQSGFRSYSTFSTAFKQVMGMNATEWMRSSTE